MDLTLTWLVATSPQEDYIAFVHIWRPTDASPVAQNDSRPRDGWFPTTAWIRGDVVPDRHRLQIPDDIKPGSYPVWAGLYRSSDATRLHATGPEGPFADNLVPLGYIEVK